MLTIIAVGVASPIAHGHAITSIDITILNTKYISFPKTAHKIPVISATPMTIGTKYKEILSASLAIGAFLPWASSMSFTILESVVSSPIFSILT